MVTTIIKCNPGQTRGRLHGYTVTQIRDGERTSVDVIALTGRDAVAQARPLLGKAGGKVAA